MPAFGLALLDVAHDRPELAFAHDGAEVVFRIERVADAPVFKLGEQGFGEGVLALAGHDDPGVGGAVFAHVPEGGSGGLRGDGGVVGHVVEHHEGALAAEFQHDALEVAPGGVFKEAAAHFGGAGEGHHVHAGVQPERFAHGGAGARDHVEHAFGDARFGGELRELQGGERGDAGGLEDDAVAFGKGGAELPAHHHEREVPRQDAGDHPGGLAHDEPQPAVSGGGDAAVLLVRAFGVPFEALDGFRQIREQAFADGLPAVQRFEDRQLDLMLFDEPDEAHEDFFALRRMHTRPGPAFKSLARRGDGLVDVFAPAGGDPGDFLARRGVDGRHCLAGEGGGECPADKGFGRVGQVRGNSFVVGVGQQCHGGISLIV